MNLSPENQSPFDLVFAGFGASACLLIIELERKGWLHGKRIAILEPDSKDRNDRTFCFWAADDADISETLKPLISHRWSSAELDGRVQDISPLRYCHIRGIDLYGHTRKLLENQHVLWQKAFVSDVSKSGDLIVCGSSSGDFSGLYCFDSRPLPKWAPELPQVALIQSFHGWKIRLQDSLCDPDIAVLMDFDVAQDGATQFVYRLPFSSSEVLVELTRFGCDVIQPETAEVFLSKYVTEKYGRFEILEREEGRIPMESGRQLPTPVCPEHIILGSRAGMVKASTGYAFKNMFAAARSCAEQLAGNEGERKKNIQPGRFGFYDQLLLLILRLWPWQGRQIFKQLLAGVSANHILKFLDERSSVKDEAHIFSKLPILVFIKAVFVREYFNWRRYRTELLVLAGTLALIFFYVWLPEEAVYTAYSILIAGLVLVGIPHGALDDILLSGNGIRRLQPGFIIKYLLQGVLMLAIWWILPSAALVIFLIYSAWHFGQADMEESGSSALKNSALLPVLSFAHGASVLLSILLSHIQELNAILKELHVASVSAESATISTVLLAGSLLSSMISGNRRSLLGFLTIAATTQLPLLISFGIYFVFQHSWRGWKHIRNRIRKDNSEMFRMALPFQLAAWGLLAFLYLADPNLYGLDTGFGKVGLFFVFLSSLSLPHVLAMHRFYGRAAA